MAELEVVESDRPIKKVKADTPDAPPSPVMARKAEIDKQAEEIRAKRELPKKPGDRVKLSELEQYIGLLSEEQLGRLNIYVYRLDPVIIRQVVDPESANNIDVIYDVRKEEVTEQRLIDKHGGGKYRLVVADLDKKDKNLKGGFFEAFLYVPHSVCAPKLDLREVDWDHPNNKGYKAWARSQRLIDNNNMPVVERKNGLDSGASDANVSPILDRFISMYEKMNRNQQDDLRKNIAGEAGLGQSIGAILVEKMKQDNPNAAMDSLAKMMAVMMPKPEKNDGGLAALLIPMLNMQMESMKQQTMMMQESNKTQMALFLKMMEMNAPKGEERDEIARMKDLMEVAKMMKGGTAEKEEGLGESIVKALSSIVPQGLALANTVMTANMASKGVQVPNVPPPVPSTSTNQLSPPTYTPPNQPTNQPTEPESTLPPMTFEQKQMGLRQMFPLINRALEQGKEGWEFAEQVEDMFGAGGVALLAKDGKDELLKVAKSLPEIWDNWVRTYGEPHLMKWVDEFIRYKEIGAEADKQEEEK